MASKGKDKRKPKKDETEFNDKRIDLIRLAYDIIKCTALKFHVPENCIAVWDGPANDYGLDDFCLVVCRLIIKCQIFYRYQFHKYFSKHYDSNKLAEPRLIGRLLQEVINNGMDENLMTPVDRVEFSLAVACELFLFLYSKTISMHPKQMATYWFQCYLNINKKQFENDGGLKVMYEKGQIFASFNKDALIDKYIEEQCLPYDTSANDPHLKDFIFLPADERIRKYGKVLPRKDHKEVDDFMRENERYKRQLPNLNFITEGVVVRPPAPASGVNVPQNTNFGTIPHDKAFQLQNTSVTSPQKPSAASAEGPTRHGRTLSCKKGKMMKSSSSASVEQCPGQSSSSANVEQCLGQSSPISLLTDRLSQTCTNVSITEVGKVICVQFETKPTDRVQNTASSGMKTGESSSRLSVEQGHGQLSSASSMALATWQSNKLQGGKSKVPEQNTGSSGLQRGESSVSSVEQGIGLLSLGSSERKMSDVLAADDPTSQSHSGASHRKANKEQRGSSIQEKKSQKKFKK